MSWFEICFPIYSTEKSFPVVVWLFLDTCQVLLPVFVSFFFKIDYSAHALFVVKLVGFLVVFHFILFYFFHIVPCAFCVPPAFIICLDWPSLRLWPSLVFGLKDFGFIIRFLASCVWVHLLWIHHAVFFHYRLCVVVCVCLVWWFLLVQKCRFAATVSKSCW